MRWYPACTEAYRSPLAPAELLRRLHANMVPKPTGGRLFYVEPPGLFQGEVGVDSFAIRRVVRFKEPMPPRISGAVLPAADGLGSVVRLQHRLFFGVGYSVVLCLLVSLIVTLCGARSGHGVPAGSGGISTFLGVFATGAATFTLQFWLEVGRSRPLLVRLLALQPNGSS